MREIGEPMEHLTHVIVRAYAWLAAPERRNERGDVPGWVMITVMTVAIVGAIWAVADEQLTEMLRTALGSVSKG
jgi:hypothetical protein